MSNITTVVWFLLVVVFLTMPANCREPACSRFSYDEQLLEKLVRMEFRMETLVKDVSVLHNELQKEIVKSQESAINFLEEIQTERNSMKSEFAELKDAYVKEISQQLIEMKIVVNSQGAKIHRMSGDLRQLQNTTSAKPTAPIVFFAVSTPTKQLVDGVPTFSVVNANHGGGYDTTTGQFTCTVPGLYHFSITFMTYYHTRSGAGVLCYIRRNKQNIVSAYTDTVNTAYQSASASTYVYLDIGDIVDIGNTVSWSYVHNNPAGMFNGALITPK